MARAGAANYWEIPACTRAGQLTVNHGVVARGRGAEHAAFRKACRDAATARRPSPPPLLPAAAVAIASVASRGRRLRHSPMADTQRRQVKLVLSITRRGLEARPPFLGGFVEPRANAHARGLTKLCDC